MLQVVPSTRFRRDLKRLQRRGKDIDKLEIVVDLLQTQTPLPEKNRDHNLTGNWNLHRECHIESDWLLIYQVDEEDNVLYLTRTGTHTDLFML